MDINEENLEAIKDAKIKDLKILLIHRINALKTISQNVHGSYIALEGVEYKCVEAIALLSPLFRKWGSYIHFFNSIITILPQKKDLPKETIVST